MSFRRFLKRVFELPLIRLGYVEKWQLYNLRRSGALVSKETMNTILEDAINVFVNKKPNNLRVALVLDGSVFIDSKGEKYFDRDAYWPKFERFLIANSIEYKHVDIHRSDWFDQLQGCNVLIWRIDSHPISLQEAKGKIYFLENFLRIKCYPGFQDIWHYEDKGIIHQMLRWHGLPEIPTFFSFSRNEALDYVFSAQYPLISKIITGSSSRGVELISSKREGVKCVDEAFSSRGRLTFWPFLRQKGYVYFQKYIGDAECELRIIVIGNKYFGYYKKARKGDFKASGSGIIEKRALPAEGMDIARSVKQVFRSQQIAVDFLYSGKDSRYYIIEVSFFIRVITPAQLKINEIPGYYEYDGCDYRFIEGKYWIQELALKDFIESISN